MNLTLPTDSAARKAFAVFTGCLAYFPAAIAGVARHSKAGNDKHNPGTEMHHSRGKSGDHADCIVRHLMDMADMLAAREREYNNELSTDQEAVDHLDAAILQEADALSWRALALSQELHEKLTGMPLAPRAKISNDT